MIERCETAASSCLKATISLALIIMLMIVSSLPAQAERVAALMLPPEEGNGLVASDVSATRNDGTFENSGHQLPQTADVEVSLATVPISGTRATDPSNQLMLPLITLSGQHLPMATDDSYQTFENKPLVVNTAHGVLTNDSDPEMDPLHAVLVSEVSNGVLNLAADGSFHYTPDTDFIGQDLFTYQASDAKFASNLATVTISVSIDSLPQIVTGEISFTKQIIDDTVDATHAVVAADLDDDDDIDLVATDYVDGSVFWYENDGSGEFVSKVLDANLPGAYPAHVGDVDGDGNTDVLAAGYTSDTFVWYRNDGAGSFTRQDIDTASDGAHSIVTADLDDDGDIDLVTSSQDANLIAWYENDGTNSFTEHTIDSSARAAKRAEVADLDGDGDLDVVAASFDSDEIAWHENDGNENFTKRMISTTANGAYFLSPADIDGDGDLDIFTASRLDWRIMWYRNDGAANFTAHRIDASAAGARTVIAVDIDRDDHIDGLAASVNNDTIAWYNNNGSGGFTKYVIDSTADGAYGLFAIDVNNDGNVDVLSASRDANAIALHIQIRVHTAVVDMGGLLVIDSSLLLATDVDDSAADLIYTMTKAPELGEIQLDGVSVAGGGTFTQDDIDSGRLTYVHTGMDASPDRFSFTVADGIERDIQSAAAAFVINVTGLQLRSLDSRSTENRKTTP